MIQQRAAESNTVTLEAEKERDELHNQIHQIEEQLQPKRARTDDDAGDAHEKLAEVDNWDLRDHRQQATRVQTRRNVQVGSRMNQAKPRTGTDGKNHLGNASGSALASHLLQQGLGHGSHRHEDSAGCCDVSQR